MRKRVKKREGTSRSSFFHFPLSHDFPLNPQLNENNRACSGRLRCSTRKRGSGSAGSRSQSARCVFILTFFFSFLVRTDLFVVLRRRRTHSILSLSLCLSHYQKKKNTGTPPRRDRRRRAHLRGAHVAATDRRREDIFFFFAFSSPLRKKRNFLFSQPLDDLDLDFQKKQSNFRSRPRPRSRPSRQSSRPAPPCRRRSRRPSTPCPPSRPTR